MGLRAIMVAVDYQDILRISLPYNQHHFDEITIVTDPKSGKSVFDVVYHHTPDRKICILETELFYTDGAVFNKWRALEWGLDQMGRHGWICIMDADVLWPKDVVVQEIEGMGNLFIKTPYGLGRPVLVGQLCTPLRRMAPWPLPSANVITGISKSDLPYYSVIPLLPEEKTWNTYPLHRNVQEWAGYSQIFHADDPVLGPPPWHETNWKTAGSADSFFQQKWPHERKIRPPFHCLHLGPSGVNWCGRVTPYLDGSKPPEADQRSKMMQDLWTARKGRSGNDRFWKEKL
jgi:hypothetical protein